MDKHTNSKDDEKGKSCYAGGSCLTNNRMCPGIAIIFGYLAGAGSFYLFHSESIAWGVGIVVSASLIFGLHSRIWSHLRKKMRHTQ